MRVYRYQGNPSRLKRVKEVGPGIPLESQESFKQLEHVLLQAELDGLDRPQTYVVTSGDGFFRCGGALQEYLDVAGGQDVLAAGEAWFAKDKSGWYMDRVNNRSVGYRIPLSNAYKAIEVALGHAGIRHPGRFTKVFTGRTCSSCGEFNVWPGEHAPYCKACNEDFNQ